MSKKKSKKKYKKLDMNLNLKYDEVLDEIENLQKYLKKVDKKAKKKAKKKANGDAKLYKKLYKSDMSRAKARYKVVKENEGLFVQAERVLKDIEPAAKMISRFVAGLIVTTLSIDFVQTNITPVQIENIDKIYKLSMKV